MSETILPPFEWKGKKYTDISEIIDVALKMKNKKELERYVKAYCARGPYARQNIGYCSGYYDRKTAGRIMEIFQTAHPIFGTSTPTTKEALQAGRALSERKRHA